MWDLREEQLPCCVTLDLVVSRQAVGIPNTRGGSYCQRERKGISRFSWCSIVWFANRIFGLIFFLFFFSLFFYLLKLVLMEMIAWHEVQIHLYTPSKYYGWSYCVGCHWNGLKGPKFRAAFEIQNSVTLQTYTYKNVLTNEKSKIVSSTWGLCKRNIRLNWKG